MSQSIAGPPAWNDSPNTWRGIVPNVWGGGTLILQDPRNAEQETVKFWSTYSTDIANKMQKAVLAKRDWVAGGKCTGKYALASVEALWKASYAFVEALNKINNHDQISYCCKHQSNGGEGEDGDTSGIDLVTYIKAIQLASNLGSADPVDGADPNEQSVNQDPEAQVAE